MPELVCICCLSAVDTEQMVVGNSHDIYHADCYANLLNIRNKRNVKSNDEIIDVTDSLVIDTSGNSIDLKYEQDYKYEKFIDLSTNDKILESYYNNKKYEAIEKILSGPDFATDIAGNIVELDKNYLISYELKKIDKLKL